MKKSKTMHDTRGWETNCSWYNPCPLCYGCRNYDSSCVRCEKCAENIKQNICDTHKHRADLLAKMMERRRVVI